MEVIPSGEHIKTPQYFEDPETGVRWTLFPDGSHSVFTPEMDMEFERQQMVYINGETPAPIDGQPLFPKTIKFRSIKDAAKPEEIKTLAPETMDAHVAGDIQAIEGENVEDVSRDKQQVIDNTADASTSNDSRESRNDTGVVFESTETEPILDLTAFQRIPHYSPHTNTDGSIEMRLDGYVWKHPQFDTELTFAQLQDELKKYFARHIVDPREFTRKSIPRQMRENKVFYDAKSIYILNSVGDGVPISTEVFEENKKNYSNEEFKRHKAEFIRKKIEKKSDTSEDKITEPATDEKEKPRREGVGSVYKATEKDAKTFEKNKPWENPDMSRYIGLKELTIGEIIDNKDHQQLFGELLGRLIPDETERSIMLAGAYNHGVLTDEQRAILAYATHEFARALDRSSMVLGKLSPRDVELLAKRDPNFENMRTLYGTEKITAILKSKIPHLAMRDPGQVDALLENYKKLEKKRGTYRYGKWEKEVERVSKATGIDPRDFDKMFDLGSKEGYNATLKRLDKKFREEYEKMPLGKRIWNISAASYARNKAEDVLQDAIKLDNQTRDLRDTTPSFSWSSMTGVSDAIDAYNPYHRYKAVPVREARDVLNAMSDVTKSITSDEVFKRQVDAASFGTTLRDTRESTVMTTSADVIREKDAVVAQMTVENMQREFDQKKTEYAQKKGKEWKDIPVDEQRTFFNTWEPSSYGAYHKEKGQGFWSVMFRALIQALYTEKKKRVKMNH